MSSLILRGYSTDADVNCSDFLNCSEALRSPSASLRAGPTRSNLCAETLGKRPMAWTTPILVEICIGLEINGYLPAEF